MSQSSSIPLIPFDPGRFLRRVEALEARFSRGLLRARPERWFPGFPTQWLPLAHSLGVELRVIEVRPILAFPRTLKHGFLATVDDEPFGIFTDETSFDVVVDAVAPESTAGARDIVGEYMARRLLSTLAQSWSGPEASTVRFLERASLLEFSPVTAIKLAVEFNGAPAVVWLLMGKMLSEKFDGLWRRQIRSSIKIADAPTEVSIEVAQLAVPPSMLVDYMRAGSIIDLEVVSSDLVTLRQGSKAWLPARICAVNGNLAFEIVSGPVHAPPHPEGTTRLAIELGTLMLDANQLSEMSQVGAIFDTGQELTDKVSLSINSEKVGTATLCLYEGRYAISVE
jgi:hypothetical protein